MDTGTQDCLKQTLERLTRYFESIKVHPPAQEYEIQRLQQTIGNGAEELVDLLRICNGIEVDLCGSETCDGFFFGIDDIIRAYPVCGLDENNTLFSRLVPIRDDLCGNYSCFLSEPGIGAGGIVFWDHEVYDAPAYLLAGSLAKYIEFWSDYLISSFEPDGEERDSEEHPWPFDVKWIRANDQKANEFLADSTFKKFLAR